MYQQTPVAELDDAMAKVQAVPTYELIHELRYGIEMFMMRVTCPLRPYETPLTAYSEYRRTPEEAKHSGALAFINTFLRDKDGVEYSPPQHYLSREDEEQIYYEKLEELETLCYDNYLDHPMFYDVSAEGPELCPIWTIECYVNDYVTEGKGRRKVQARTQAVRRMIEMLTDAMESYYESFESPRSTSSARDHAIDSQGDQPEDQDRVIKEKKTDSSSPAENLASGVPHTEACEACRSSDALETLLKSFNLLVDPDDRKKDSVQKRNSMDGDIQKHTSVEHLKIEDHGLKHSEDTNDNTDDLEALLEASLPINQRGELENICFEENLEQPIYWGMGTESPEHCLTWIIECHVSDLVSFGKGRRAAEAKAQATGMMIKMLSESTTPAYDEDIVSSSDDQNCVFDAGKPDSKSSDDQGSAFVQQTDLIHEENKLRQNGEEQLNDEEGDRCSLSDDHIPTSGAPLVEAPEACRNHNTAETLLRWLDVQRRASETKENQYDSEMSFQPKDLREISTTGSRSPSPNIDASDCVDSGVGSSDAPDPPIKLTRLQAASKINRMLRSFERELYQNILGGLVHTDLSRKATVRILNREYDVLIKQDVAPMIFEEHYECSDQSIRVACLTRLLLDLVGQIMKG